VASSRFSTYESTDYVSSSQGSFEVGMMVLSSSSEVKLKGHFVEYLSAPSLFVDKSRLAGWWSGDATASK